MSQETTSSIEEACDMVLESVTQKMQRDAQSQSLVQGCRAQRTEQKFLLAVGQILTLAIHRACYHVEKQCGRKNSKNETNSSEKESLDSTTYWLYDLSEDPCPHLRKVNTFFKRL